MIFSFLHRKIYEGSVVDLKESGFEAAERWNDYSESTFYTIRLHLSGDRIGECDLRFGDNESLYYAGHIGYRIDNGWRGHHYAYEACLMLLEIAREKYGMNHMYITCSPENIASKKTIMKLGGVYKETVNVPKWHWLYERGEKVKEIYELNF